MGLPKASQVVPAEQTHDSASLYGALTTQQAPLRLVLDHAPIGVAHCDRDGRFTFVNNGFARLFRLVSAQMVGRLISDVIGDAAYEVVRNHVEAALTGRDVEFEAAIPDAQLGTRVMHCRYRPEVDAAGEVRGVVAVLLDVTDRVQAEAARDERIER